MQAERPFIVFSLRYSLLVRKTTSWLIGKGRAFEDYKAALFDPDRLATRHYLFSRVTIPSLAMQRPAIDPARHRLCIFTSADLPSEARADLDRTVGHLPWAEVIAIKDNEPAPYAQRTLDFLQHNAGQTALYAHGRLDDDDGLSSDFLERLSQYIQPACVGMGVSFGLGVSAIFDTQSKSFTGYYERHREKNAQGLARIGLFDRATCTTPKDIETVFKLGSHKKVDRKAPTIQDSRELAHIRVTHSHQDNMPTTRETAPPIDVSALAELFPYIAKP